jgi:predicted nucleic acid-binding protein
VAGGAVYDVLVAAAALQHGAPLLSGDVRARRIYDRLGVEVVDFR